MSVNNKVKKQNKTKQKTLKTYYVEGNVLHDISLLLIRGDGLLKINMKHHRNPGNFAIQSSSIRTLRVCGESRVFGNKDLGPLQKFLETTKGQKGLLLEKH